MAETAILNANPRWDQAIDDAIGPDYGWQRLRQSQLATIKPAFGQPWTRTIGNGGHATQFSWTNRSLKCIEKLKQFAEQYEDGFFTVIDQDGGGRHYVGRFVGDMPLSEAGNDRWNITGWQFEEIPGCPMLQYPDQWERWGIQMRPYDDFGNLRVAIGSANWVKPAAVANELGVMVQPNQLQNLTPVASDWATFEYRGYGFRLWAVQDVPYGQVQLIVDGVSMGMVQLNAEADMGPTMVYAMTDLPLDVHRVQVIIPLAAAAGVATGMILDKFEVMR